MTLPAFTMLIALDDTLTIGHTIHFSLFLFIPFFFSFFFSFFNFSYISFFVFFLIIFHGKYLFYFYFVAEIIECLRELDYQKCSRNRLF